MGLPLAAPHLRTIFLDFLSIPVLSQEVVCQIKAITDRLTNPSPSPPPYSFPLHHNHNVCSSVQIKPDGSLTAFFWTAWLCWLEEKSIHCSPSGVRESPSVLLNQTGQHTSAMWAAPWRVRFWVTLLFLGYCKRRSGKQKIQCLSVFFQLLTCICFCKYACVVLQKASKFAKYPHLSALLSKSNFSYLH